MTIDDAIVQTLADYILKERKAVAWDELRATLEGVPEDQKPLADVVLRKMDKLLDKASEC